MATNAEALSLSGSLPEGYCKRPLPTYTLLRPGPWNKLLLVRPGESAVTQGFTH